MEIEGDCVKMYNKVNLFHENLDDYQQELIEYSEMSNFERDFLCGMLKWKRPHKIVEIGVSAGATTAVILSCLKTLNISCEMYSVDLERKWYKNNSFETGFVVKNHMEIDSSVDHRFILGRPIPCVIDEIGDNIDFLTLDTTHCLPGEALDFLVCSPYLEDKAVVILHDILLDHMIGCENAIVNKGLFCTVKAKKWYMEASDEYLFGLSNIAAFEVGDETRKNIKDVVMLLGMTWQYIISDEYLQKYNWIIKRYYDESLVAWIERIENMQISLFLSKQVERHTKLSRTALKKIWEASKIVILYGAGYWGSIYLKYAKLHGFPVDCFVISDGEIKETNYIDEVPVYFFSELPIEPNSGIVFRAIDENRWDGITEKLIQAGWYTIF